MASDFADLGEIESENNIFSNEDNHNRISLVKEWIISKKNQLKPWRKFLDVNDFSKPKDISEAGLRISKNISIYQANYFVVFLFFLLYCIITSPLLLFGLSALFGALYLVSTRNPNSKIKLFGREFSVGQQYLLVCLISIPILFLASAGSAVFWVIGASVFAITLHAAFSRVTDEDEILQLDEIKTLN